MLDGAGEGLFFLLSWPIPPLMGEVVGVAMLPGDRELRGEGEEDEAGWGSTMVQKHFMAARETFGHEDT